MRGVRGQGGGGGESSSCFEIILRSLLAILNVFIRCGLLVKVPTSINETNVRSVQRTVVVPRTRSVRTDQTTTVLVRTVLHRALLKSTVSGYQTGADFA